MKYGCSLEMVNMLTSGPEAFTRQSKKFWADYMKYVAAAGFTGVELPFNCFHTDAMAFETGRSGIPCSSTAIKEKYGGADNFLQFLEEAGISDGVVDIHVSTQDAMLELLACGKPPEEYFTLAETLFREALDHAENLKAQTIVISPSPEKGWLKKVFGEDLSEFELKTTGLLKAFAENAARRNIRSAVKDEFWSYFRLENRNILLKNIPDLYYAPDPAHLYIQGEDLFLSIRENARRLACVRMNDTSFSDDFNNHERINAELPTEGPQKIYEDCGEGKTDLKGMIKELDGAGYDGWIICENRNTLNVYKGLLKLGWYVRFGLQKS